ncbi:MAG TPA: hypothetical protein VF338_05510 [Leptolinea sp.]
MSPIIKRMLILSVLILTACRPTQPLPQVTVPPEKTEKAVETPVIPVSTSAPVMSVTPTQEIQNDPQALSLLKGKLVKNNQDYLLLLGMGPSSDPTLNYQFTESYHYPHERIKEDFRLIDSKGNVINFEEMDPSENNLYNEYPLGDDIYDPRIFRFPQANISGPITLEAVNLIKRISPASPLPAKTALKFNNGFPTGKPQWEIQQTVQIIPDSPFTIKYLNSLGFNKTQSCGENIKTYISGTLYLEAPEYEDIQFAQSVPPERKSEFPSCGGGSADHTCPDYSNCLTSDLGLVTTSDNQYELQISAYSQIIHGPWQVQFDLPK